jgi:hypothetical protein
VHYDYIFHTDRGSILYMFDEEEYTANDRLLLYPIPENTAGWRVRTFDELVQLIESGKALQAHPDIAEIRRKFWGSSEGQSCERIVAHVEQVLSERGASKASRTASPVHAPANARQASAAGTRASSPTASVNGSSPEVRVH